MGFPARAASFFDRVPGADAYVLSTVLPAATDRGVVRVESRLIEARCR